MAKDTQVQKKRKASTTSAPADEVAKVKKVKNLAAEVKNSPDKKRKAAEEVAPVTVKKSKTPKPTASENAKSKKTDAKPKSSEDVTVATKKLQAAKEKLDKKSKKAKQPEPEPESSEDEEEVEDDIAENSLQNDEDEDAEEDDQTEALLKGFESDGDEEEDAKEGGLEKGQEVPNALEKLTKSQKKAIKRAAEQAANDLPGVVYIGRIPHGFYENEMKAYFSQFGDILKIRLSRNRKTGASKHYAWIQFESKGVAEIVAKTMDNYLLFNHILKVKLIPDEQVSPDLFKGANRRFKKVPWNKIEGRKLEQGAGEEQWEKRIAKAEKKREKKLEKLKNGMDYEFEAPKLKSAKGVAKKPVVPEITENGEEGSAEEETKTIEAPSTAVEEPVKSKKEKKSKKSKVIIEETATATVEEESVPETIVKKSKVVEETPAEVVTTTTTEVVEKPKKGKKSKKVKA